MKEYGFGIDIGGTTIKCGFFRTNGELVEKWEIPTRIDNSRSSILNDIVATVQQKMTEQKIPNGDVIGVGVGVPGPVLADGTVNGCVNIGWGKFNVEEELSSKLQLPVKAGNDANVAAMGEMWKGAGEGAKNLVMITLGTGVGGGIIINGKVVDGTHGASGEIGHFPVRDDETEVCGCGKKGCLEQYASANGVVRLARKKLKQNHINTMLKDADELTAKDIFEAAKEGDSFAIELKEEVGNLLGRNLANIACVVDPEVFVIGGGMSKAGDILLESIQRNYRKYAFHASRDSKFKLAKLGNDAGIYGGVGLLL